MEVGKKALPIFPHIPIVSAIRSLHAHRVFHGRSELLPIPMCAVFL